MIFPLLVVLRVFSFVRVSVTCTECKSADIKRYIRFDTQREREREREREAEAEAERGRGRGRGRGRIGGGGRGSGRESTKIDLGRPSPRRYHYLTT